MHKGECNNEKQFLSRSMKLCNVCRIGLVGKRQDEGMLLGARGGGGGGGGGGNYKSTSF